MIKMFYNVNTPYGFKETIRHIQRSVWQTKCDNELWEILGVDIDDALVDREYDRLCIRACRVFGVEYEEVTQ